MNNLDADYLSLMNRIIKSGTQKEDRTGVGTRSISGAMIQHYMNSGFPAITTKRLYFKTMAVELEGFLKGVTDKQWYKDRKCNIWNQWCRPSKIPTGLSNEDRKAFQLNENDLGPIYGSQWRDFNGEGYDQLSKILDLLENNPSDRRMIVSAWNPLHLEEMALPPCHYSFQIIVRGDRLDLLWNQRSVDTFLGLPFNIASYGLLLSLLAKQFGYKPGVLTGFLGDTHVYNNHHKQIEEQSKRLPFALPQLKISDDFKDVREFDHTMVSLKNYEFHPAIKAEIAI